ncbi:MAG: galactose-1-phosphate uridylyltransferase [Cytophagaceae bacterium]|nr:galactose-1-phosphate uridylyltransferase [Cytophagaceae bacterium]
MSELRWNPLLRTYTMVASNRQERPTMPKDWCPFCPGSGKVPDNYDVLTYPNDFPTLLKTPAKPDVEGSGIYQAEGNYGLCEVILYSPDHHISLPELSSEHIHKLVNLWVKRTNEISKDDKIKYIFIFENRGEEVGVTMPHPHGQIYGYPFIPLKLKLELDSCKEYYAQTGKSMLLDMNKQEKNFGERVIFENDSFIAYIPFFTDYPYGVFIVAKNQRSSFTDFEEAEQKDLAVALKNITGALDNLFDRPFPYMMCVHQAPVHSPEYKDTHLYFNFHIEFYPVLRDGKRVKYYASSEMGAWAAANTRAVEETAEELRQALNKYVTK